MSTNIGTLWTCYIFSKADVQLMDTAQLLAVPAGEEPRAAAQRLPPRPAASACLPDQHHQCGTLAADHALGSSHVKFSSRSTCLASCAVSTPFELYKLKQQAALMVLVRFAAGEAVLSARLKLIGSCRNAGDEARVEALRRQAAKLQIQDCVDFHVNAPWDEVGLQRSPDASHQCT